MSILEALGTEVVKALEPSVTSAVSTGVKALAQLIARRVRVLPRDPVRAAAVIARLAAEDPEFRRVLAEHLAALGGTDADRTPMPGPFGFVDRDAQRARLAGPGTFLVAGAPGTGKTDLARQVLHDGAESFPDGQFLIDLDAYRTPAGVLRYAAVQREVLTQFRVREIETSEALLDDQYLRALLRRRFAVAFDNIADAEEVRHLARGWPAATVLLTTRRLAYDLRAQGPPAIVLHGLDEAGVRRLLDDAGATATMDAEPADAAELLALCDGFPLTLRLAAFLLTSRAGEPGAVRKTLAELRSNPDPDGTDATMIGRALGLLPEPVAADLALLTRHPGTDFTFESATVLLGRPAEPTVRALQAACLLIVEPGGRLRLPGPVRAFGARANLSETVVGDALDRLLDTYARLAVTADVIQEPDRLRRFPVPDDLAWVEAASPIDWLDAHAPMLADLARIGESRGPQVAVVQLCGALEALLTYRGRHQLVDAALAHGVRAAEALGRPAVLCRLHLTRSRVARELGHLDRAASALAEAIEAAAGLDDPRLVSSVFESRSALERQRGNLAAAIELMAGALEIDRDAGLSRPRGLHARMQANLLVAADRADQAPALLDEAAEHTDQPRNLSRVHAVRARAFLALGRAPEAAAEIGHARRLTLGSGAAPRYESELTDLEAEAARQTGDIEGARVRWGRLARESAQNGSPLFDTYLRRLNQLPPG